MKAPITNEAGATTTAQPPGISRLVRRIHMFTGLFLTPWMVMYALSTLVMTHQEYLNSFYTSKSPVLVKERELDYSRSFPTNLTRDVIAQQILNDLGLDGAHSVSGGRNGTPLIIQRQHAMPHRRLTFDSSMGRITIEREELRTSTVLERLHRRRGYNQPYALEDTWGFTVDVAVVSMIFWTLSGIWLAWELKTTRVWGALSLVVGLGLFVVFAALI
jgi:hypothetical protein